MLNGKQMLNKTDVQSFLQNFLFTLRMMCFYKCLTEYSGTFTETFLITIQESV